MAEFNEFSDWSVSLPSNIKEFVSRHKAVVDVSVNHTDAMTGYGAQFYRSVAVKVLDRECIRCHDHENVDVGLNPMFPCERHAWGDSRYTTVFYWEEGSGKLDECFKEWKAAQHGHDGFALVEFKWRGKAA